MGAAIAGQQTRARANVGAGQFQVATPLARSGTGAAAMHVPAITMPFELGLGDIGDNVVVALSGRFEVVATAMRAVLGMNVVLDELGVRGRFRSEGAGMLAMLLPAAVVGSTLPRRAFGLGALAALQEGLDLMLELRDPLAQRGIFGFEFRNPEITRVVHGHITCQNKRCQER